MKNITNKINKDLEIEIGDSKVPDEFLPQLKIKKWGNECNFSARLIHDENNPIIVEEENKIKWKGEKIECHFYDVEDKEFEDGGSEFEIILKKKPVSNILEFSIKTKNFDFYYQPVLTQKENGNIRPENVNGSYSVHHFSKKNNEYKTGKAFHIYRPKIKDALGKEVWGKLDIDVENEKMTIEIEKEFLNKAVFPVFIDPTFGFTAIGASENTTTIPNGMRGSVFTCPQYAKVDGSGTWPYTVQAYCKSSLTGGYFKNLIVDHDGLIIKAIGSGDGLGITYNWARNYSFPTLYLTKNKEYVLMVLKGGEGVLMIKYDSGANNQGHSDATNNYTSPTDPTDAVHDNNKYSIFCTYAAAKLNKVILID